MKTRGAMTAELMVLLETMSEQDLRALLRYVRGLTFGADRPRQPNGAGQDLPLNVIGLAERVQELNRERVHDAAVVRHANLQRAGAFLNDENTMNAEVRQVGFDAL